MSRVPFHLVGIFPLILGTILVWNIHGLFNLPLFILNVTAVVLIMLNTYYTGEYSDIVEDKLSGDMEKNSFSGGTQVIAQGLLPGRYAKMGSYIALGLAVMTGLVIHLVFKTGPLTIPLGVLGMLGGVFYSLMPVRWVARGLGEIIIGFCYGWLPVAVSCYLQCGRIEHIVHYISLPIACTIFNVILVNEFPDYPADVIARKTNLVVRYGKKTATRVYVGVTITEWGFIVLSIFAGVPVNTLFFYVPFFILSCICAFMMSGGMYAKKRVLEIICAFTIIINLGTTFSYIMGYLGKGA